MKINLKKSSTYYFLFLVLANLCFGAFLKNFDGTVQRSYDFVREGSPLPFITSFVLGLYWWPYIFVIISGLALAISVVTKFPDKALLHVVISILIVEMFIFAGLMVVYFMPYVPIFSGMRWHL